MEMLPVPSGRKLTTLTMWTRSRFYQNDLGCLVIGFSRDPDDVPQRTRDLLYITSTGEDLNTRLLRSSGISRRPGAARRVLELAAQRTLIVIPHTAAVPPDRVLRSHHNPRVPAPAVPAP
jgi:hypothetical protein